MAIYAVTGGAGFIGSHLVDDLLADGHEVRVLDDLSTGRRSRLDPRASLSVADTSDPEALDALLAGADGVFHLAAIASVVRAHEEWEATHRVNVGGTVAVLNASRRAGGLPVVYASSAAVYGNQQGPAREEARPAPLSAYGVDKFGSELHAKVAFTVAGVPSLGLRFFNVYGPRQDPRSPYSGVISVFASRAARRERLTIHGDGGQSRDFVYVADVVRHLRAALALLNAQPQAAVMNVCTGSATSILELARLITRLTGGPAEWDFAPGRDGDVRNSLGNPDRARALLGIRAETSLEYGLAMTLETGVLTHAA